MPMSLEDRAHIEQMLDKHRRNLRRLQSQAVDYGPSNVPLNILNGIDSEQAAIDRYEAQLAGVLPATPPAPPTVPAAGGSVFNQTRQQVGIQYNAAGDQAIHQPAHHTYHIYEGGKIVSGDTFNMSGNFSGAILNIKNTLTNTIQTVNGMTQAAPDQKQELAQLLEQLQTALTTVPAEHEETAEAVADTAKELIEKAAKDKPNKTTIQITADGLKAAATNLAAVLPTILPIATQIAQSVQKLIGG